MIATDSTCVIDEFQQLAAGSQGVAYGSAIDVRLSNNDVLYDKLVSLLSQYRSNLDCNANGVPDDCECLVSADLNDDGAVTPADFSTWIAAYNVLNPSADMNCDGEVTPADLSAWISAFNSGYIPCN